MTKKRSGLTLVEMIVVMAIILVLAGLIFVVSRAAIESSKRTTAISNLHQLGKAQLLYGADNNDYLPLYCTHLNPPDQNVFFSAESTGAHYWKKSIMKYVKNDDIFFSSLDPYAGKEVSDPEVPYRTIRTITSFGHSVQIMTHVKEGYQVHLSYTSLDNPAETPWMHDLPSATIRNEQTGTNFEVPSDGKFWIALYFDGHVDKEKFVMPE